MFTGLIETIGKIENIVPKGGDYSLSVDVSGLRAVPQKGASIAVNGVCLTVTSLSGNIASFDAVSETISRTNLKNLAKGNYVNLESALKSGDPLDGHIVQGHVDCISNLLEIKEFSESSVYYFSLPDEIAQLVAEKGSIAVNGVSLTVVGVFSRKFSVSLIPETLENTNLKNIAVGAEVNLEADVISRYIARIIDFRTEKTEKSSLTLKKLAENGFL